MVAAAAAAGFTPSPVELLLLRSSRGDLCLRPLDDLEARLRSFYVGDDVGIELGDQHSDVHGYVAAHCVINSHFDAKQHRHFDAQQHCDDHTDDNGHQHLPWEACLLADRP